MRARIALLWTAGIDLRLPLLAVPPLLVAIHHDLLLDEKAVGALTGLPVLLLASASVPGALLVARLGARRALVVGLCIVAIAGAARGAGPSTFVLFAMTVLMGVGIAISQPALPSLVGAWAPGRIGLATAVFSNGLLIGEVLAVALTVPVVLPLVGGRWPLALAAWSIPILLTAAAVLRLTPHIGPAPGASPARWWPDWRSSRTWRLGLLFGGASATYFGSNAFIPDYLRAVHHPELITAALTSLNLFQLPASALVAAAPGRMVGRRWPFVFAGFLTLLALVGFLRSSGPGLVAWAGVLGFCGALTFTLNLALPPMLAGPNDAHRLSAAMFTIGYTLSFVGPLVGGALWDWSGVPSTAFTPVLAAGALTIVLALGLDLAPAAPAAHAR